MSHMAMVDLSGVRSRDEVAGMRLEKIGAVLVPEDLPDLLAGVACDKIGAIIPVPAGCRVVSQTGNLEIAGESLAAGDDKTILMLVGQVVVTPEVSQVGYRGVILIGVALLPRGAQKALAGKLINQTGEILYYEGANPRVFVEDMRFTKGFLDLVQEPMALLLIGDGTFAADVTPELLSRKVQSIALIGDATVEDPALLPMVQYLAKHAVGSIKVASAGTESA